MKSKPSIFKDTIVREIFIGGVSKNDLLKLLKENKISTNEFALNLINNKKFNTSPIKKKLKTVEISVKDLGIPNGATICEIYQKAKTFGFKLCPHELALHMRLQHIDFNQPIDPPKGNWQSIAIKDISEEPGFIHGLYLRHREDGFWLRGYRASFDHLWDPADRFIFVL